MRYSEKKMKCTQIIIGLIFILSTSLMFLCSNLYALESTIELSASPKMIQGSMLGSSVAGDTVILNSTTRKIQKAADSSVSLNLETNMEKDIIALHRNGNVILLSHTFGTQDHVVIDAESSAISLVLLSPTMLGLTSAQQQAIIPLIKQQPHFPHLIERIQKNIEIDNQTPLDYFIHSFLAADVEQVIKELTDTDEFSNIVSFGTTEEYKTTRSQLRESNNWSGFELSCKDANGNPVANCNDAATLAIKNPKAIYYGAYIDPSKIDVLDAKDGLVNVELGLWPPKFEVSSNKETEFSLERFGNGKDTYNINLTSELGWNPLTADGIATWMNSIKGLSLMVELAGFVPNNSRSKITSWISGNSAKLKTISDSVVNKELIRSYLIVGKAFTEAVGMIYENMPENNPYKEGIGEFYYNLNKISLLTDKLIDLLSLSPLDKEEIKYQINYQIKRLFQYESSTELLAVVKKGENISFIYEQIKTKIMVEVQQNFSIAIMNTDIPFNYDYVLQKISGFYSQLETSGLFDSILKILLNDILSDTTKAIANFILKNAFGMPYKIAVTANKIVPYTYDMLMAPDKVTLPVYNGKIAALESPTLSSFSIKNKNNEQIYSYLDNNEKSQDFVTITPGECIKVSYSINMPGNFEKSSHENDEFWMLFGSSYPNISSFKATLAGRFETIQWSGKYTRTKLLEKELVVSDGWTLNRYYNGQDQTIELDDNPDNWTSEQLPFKYNRLQETQVEFCFATEEDIPDQFILNYSNLNYESTGSFLVNIRKSNKPPIINSISKHPKNDNNKVYIFDNIGLSDDYTRADDIKLEVSYGDGTVETIQGGANLFSFSHQYVTQGEYKVTFKAIDDQNAYSEAWYETVYPGYAYPDATLSSSYINFGNVAVGSQTSQNITIKNSGFAPLEIGIFILNSDVFDINSNNCENGVIAPNESCNFNITFQPLEKSAYNAEIIIPTNKLNSENVIIKIVGNGIIDESIPTSYEKIFKPYQITNANGTTTTISTYNPSGAIYGNVKLESGTLDLQGQTLVVYGHLIHSGGTLKVNGGTLIVKGDYRIQTPPATTGGAYTYSTGILNMTNTADKVLVEDSFTTDSYNSHQNLLTAGVLEVRGNFTQLLTSTGYPSNFYASGTHKVLLSGNAQQMVSFKTPGVNNSRFNILEIAQGSIPIVFSTNFNVVKLISNGRKLTSLTIAGMNWVLNENQIVAENLQLSGNILDLNGKTLTIEGNLIHSGGTLKVNGGTLIVKGDYCIQTPPATTGGAYTYSTGILNMTNTADKVLVEGSFTTDSYNSHQNLLTAGVLEVKGNFTQLLTSTGYPSNFYASGTHKVLLSGNAQQMVSFKTPGVNNSRFNILEIAQGSIPIVFSTNFNIVKLISNGRKLTSLTIVGMDWVMNENQIAAGNLQLSGNILDLNGKTLTIEGNLIHSGGTLKVNGGTLIVNGDYRIQTPPATTGGAYTYSGGILNMTNTADKVLVEGSFTTDSYNSHQNLLTAGVLEVRGNFTQLLTSTGYSSNFYASGTHKVLLSGNAQQMVSFKTPGVNNSRFNILEIAQGSIPIVFSTNFNIVKLISNGRKLTSLTIVGMDWVMNENQIAAGNLQLSGNILDLNGKTLTIEGNLIHSGGTLKVNGGTLIVKGDYRIQTPPATTGGAYTYSTGILNMTNTADKVLVEGSFTTDSYNSHQNLLTAGVLEVRGNFTQLLTSTGYPSNFYASGTHKVLLSGNAQQMVSFKTPGVNNSRFNILEIAQGSIPIVFSTNFNVVKLISNGRKLTSLTIVGMDWVMNENQIAAGNLQLSGNILDLNGKTLTIEGNLIHSGGTLKVNGGTLIVKGDYRIQTPPATTGGAYTYSTGILNMTNTADKVLVEDSFTTDSYNSHQNLLTAGVLEVRGNFTQLLTSTGYSSNFYASGTHKVLLSGNAQQMVSFKTPGVNNSRFNELEITNPQGAVFATNAIVYATCPTKTITSYADYLNCIGSASIGGLIVNIQPSEVAALGAWRLTGTTTWNTNGYKVDLAAGSYTIEFKNVPDWTKPANQTVKITNGLTTTITGTYTQVLQQSGSVKVTISPTDAVNAGAAWQIDGGAWNNSGVTVSNLSVGTHTVAFKDLTGWTKPANKTVSIQNGLTATATGTYTQIQQLGSLTVTISPANAVTAGAAWQVDGGVWNKSGVTVNSITAGTHTVSFKDITGWTKPSSQSVTIQSGVTSKLAATYIQSAGQSFVIRTLPDFYMPSIKLTVTLIASPATGVSSYQVEDSPPAGWTVENINQNGVFDSTTNKVKFGLFSDSTKRTLTYDVTPPSNAIDKASFIGRGLADGVGTEVGGDSEISSGLNHPADITPLDFSLSSNELTAYGAAWKKGTTWSSPPNPIPVDYVTRAGYLWKSGEKYDYDFSAGAAPFCWIKDTTVRGSQKDIYITDRDVRTMDLASAVCEMDTIYYQETPFIVTITVTPPEDVFSYAVEDVVPQGWIVEDVSDSGTFDTVSNKVKYGPFFDNTTRTVTYQITPSAESTGAYTFAGKASFDGESIDITEKRAVMQPN